MKCLAFVAFVVVSGVAGASSFDMMLIVDQGNRIYRHDVGNNVALGFIATTGNVRGLAVDQPSGTVFAFTTGPLATAIQRYNIWTGELLSTIPITPSTGLLLPMSMSQTGDLLITRDTGLQRINRLTGAQIGSNIAWSSTDFTYNARGAQLANGEFAVYGETDGAPFPTDRVMLFNSSNTWQASSIITNTAGSTVGVDLAARGNDLLVGYTDLSLSTTYVSLARRGATTFTSTQLFSGSINSNQIQGLEWGHTDEAYALFLNPSTGYFYRKFSTVTGSFSPNVSLSYLTNTSSTAMFLAPEPGTIAAFGLGAGFLLKRRRNLRDAKRNRTR